jgi:hypothetical protein
MTGRVGGYVRPTRDDRKDNVCQWLRFLARRHGQEEWWDTSKISRSTGIQVSSYLRTLLHELACDGLIERRRVVYKSACGYRYMYRYVRSAQRDNWPFQGAGGNRDA